MRDSSGAVPSDESVLGLDPTLPNQPMVFEKLPAEAWAEIPSAVSDSLSRGIKKVYDPNNILNPGILGD
jgi:FAD/FMN-containing dehydrogenase